MDPDAHPLRRLLGDRQQFGHITEVGGMADIVSGDRSDPLAVNLIARHPCAEGQTGEDRRLGCCIGS